MELGSNETTPKLAQAQKNEAWRRRAKIDAYPAGKILTTKNLILK